MSCPVCAEQVSGAGTYCSNACRQRAYRDRRDAAAGEPIVPLAIDRFVGRADDLAAVRRLLGRHQRVVLTGPTGVGKTRLALEIARQRAARGGRVRLVDLGPDPVEQDPIVPPTGFLVLDTCEHRLEYAARISTAGARVLATSTVALPGFVEYRLAGLPAPDGCSAAECLGFDAVQLFLDRAPDLLPDDDTLLAIGRLCTALEGSPFAIELAVRQLAARTPEQLADAAGDLFTLLPDGFRTAPPRQRGLRAAARWGYELLTPPQQAAVRALSLLPAGANAELAGVEPGLAESLVDRSLAVRDGDRYRLLAPMRLLGAAELTACGEFGPALDRLVDRFVALGRSWFDSVFTPEPDLLRWCAEAANLAHVVELLAATDDERQLFVAALLARTEPSYGYSATCVPTLLRALANTDPGSAYRAPAQENVVYLEATYGDPVAAVRVGRAALTEERLRDRPIQLARLLDAMSFACSLAGELSTAVEHMRERVELSDRLDDPMARSSSLDHMAWLLIELGDFAAARAAAEEALPAFRRHQQGPLRMAPVLCNAGTAALCVGDFDAAAERFGEIIGMAGVNPGTCAFALEGMAMVELARGRPQRCATLIGASARLRDTLPDELDQWWGERLDEAWADVTERLPEGEADRAVRDGRKMDAEQVVAYVSGAKVPHRHPAGSVLSSAQLDVVRLLTEGLTNQEIARRLDLSARGVEERIRQVKALLHVRSRAQVAAWGVRLLAP